MQKRVDAQLEASRQELLRMEIKSASESSVEKNLMITQEQNEARTKALCDVSEVEPKEDDALAIPSEQKSTAPLVRGSSDVFRTDLPSPGVLAGLGGQGIHFGTATAVQDEMDAVKKEETQTHYAENNNESGTTGKRAEPSKSDSDEQDDSPKKKPKPEETA